jgi:hypothetical protein
MKANSNFEEGLLTALKALDNQISRSLQRDPATRSEQGLQKWQPYQDRIESSCSFLLNSLGDEAIDLDGLIILTQSFSKCLNLIAADLGEKGLGKIRTEYIKATFKALERDAEDVEKILTKSEYLS